MSGTNLCGNPGASDATAAAAPAAPAAGEADDSRAGGDAGTT
ncbi:hypothetical protein [Arthrobacter silvisoli]